jgi:hypothetical protein
MSPSIGNNPFRGTGLVVLVVLSVVILSLVVALVDWAGSRNVGAVTATVETIGDTSTARTRRPYVVVHLDEGGRATASNPSRLPAMKGTRVELEDWQGTFLGSHRYVVRAVLPPASAGAPDPARQKGRPAPLPSRRELTIVGALLLLVSVGSILHLWVSREATVLRKLGWTAIILVPLFGPGFYFVLFDRLRGQPAHLRARMNEFIRTGGMPGEGPH